MGSFQYVCDSEQMLSLFGCRVSNDLNFEWHFMLHDILAGYFLCTAGYDIMQTFNLGDFIDVTYYYPDDDDDSSLYIGNTFHDLPCGERSASTRLESSQRLLQCNCTFCHRHPRLCLQHWRDAWHYGDSCSLQHGGKLYLWDTFRLLVAKWQQRAGSAPAGGTSIKASIKYNKI